MSKTIDQNARPVIFGELLFDHYPDGSKVLAGAPLAVAWHCQGFGLRPILITRIGQDTEGELALMAMHQWGLDTRAVQIDSDHSTGSADIKVNEGDNYFEIKPDQAWDYINSHLALEWVKTLHCSMLYAGSLAQRNQVSRRTFKKLIQETQLPLFIDINIREPWCKSVIIEKTLVKACWLKINDEELNNLSNSDSEINDDDVVVNAQQLKSKYNIETIYITRGKKGAMIIDASECLELHSNNLMSVVDSVGAGDAFTAVCILGIHKNWNQRQTLSRAIQFSEKICKIQGATSLTKKIYTDLLTEWI